MLRTPIASIFLILVTAPMLPGAVYELEGSVTNGTSLFPPDELELSFSPEQFGAPAGGFPVDFTARLELSKDPTNWSFGFIVTDDERSVEHIATGPTHPFARPERITNEVAVSSDQVAIEFLDHSTAFSERLNLSLDLMSGTGQWE